MEDALTVGFATRDTPLLVLRAGGSRPRQFQTKVLVNTTLGSAPVVIDDGVASLIQRVKVSVRPRFSFRPLCAWSAMGAKTRQPGVRSGFPEYHPPHFLRFPPTQPSVASIVVKQLLYGYALFGGVHPGEGLISLPGGGADHPLPPSLSSSRPHFNTTHCSSPPARSRLHSTRLLALSQFPKPTPSLEASGAASAVGVNEGDNLSNDCSTRRLSGSTARIRHRISTTTRCPA